MDNSPDRRSWKIHISLGICLVERCVFLICLFGSDQFFINGNAISSSRRLRPTTLAVRSIKPVLLSFCKKLSKVILFQFLLTNSLINLLNE